MTHPRAYVMPNYPSVLWRGHASIQQNTTSKCLLFSFAQQNYTNVVVCVFVLLHFHQKVQLQQSRAAEQLLNIVVFRNYFTLEFFRLFFNFTSFLSKSPTAAEQSRAQQLFSELFYLRIFSIFFQLWVR